jgi:hypothetical protein
MRLRMLRIGGLLILSLAVASASMAACSAFDAATDSQVEGGADGADSAIVPDGAATPDGKTPGTQPTPCPLLNCPPPLKELCADEACGDGGKNTIGSGTFSSSNGKCTAQATDAFAFLSRGSDQPGRRRIVELLFTLESVTGSPSGIAAIRTDQDDTHAILLVVQGAGLQLCELNSGVTTCAETIPLPVNGSRLHLYGVASGDDPPNATFALRVGCGTTDATTLPVTRPFPAGRMRGLVGCQTPPGVTCNHVFDDMVFIGRPE